MFVPDPMNPQSFNRYSYCLNNPLKYTDPSGHVVGISGFDVRYFEDYITNPEYLSIFGTAHELDAAIHSEEYKTHQQVCNQNPDWATNLEQSSTVYEVILPVSTDSTIQTVEYASESLTYNVDIQETYVTAPVPESNWYLDFNLSVGYVLGLTGGIMTNENETYFYLGFGIVYSPSVSITYCGNSKPTEGWSWGAQGTLGVTYQYGHALGDLKGPLGPSYSEIGPGWPGGSLTLYKVWKAPQ
jgi:hypothetical protein